MSKTETVSLTISTAEVQSIADVASMIANTIQKFAKKYKVGDQYNRDLIEQDMVFFLAKRKALGLEQLEVYILDDGKIGVGSFGGKRKATLVFRINYVGRAARF